MGRTIGSKCRFRRFSIVMAVLSFSIAAFLSWGIAACSQEQAESPTEPGISATSGALAGMTPVISAPEASEHSENIVRFDNHRDGVVIHNPVRKIIKGERVNGNCVFSHRMEAPHDGSPRYSRPVWINYDTCERMIEEGEISPEDAKKLSQSDGIRSETPAPPTPQPSQ